MATRSLGISPISPSPSGNRIRNIPCCSAKPSFISFPHRHLFFPPNTGTAAEFNKELSLGNSSSSSSTIPPSHKPSVVVIDEQDQAMLDKCVVRGQKHLRELSSWGIGGPCSYFLEVSRPSHLVSAIRYCKARSMPFLIVGKGSNCLFEDRGFDGFVMLNRLEHSAVEVVEPGTYRVGSAFPFNRLGVRCSSEGFSGLEFAGGIPGTVGGATFMNAGANGQETGDVIESVEIVTMDGELRVLGRSELDFGYRWSSFQEMDDLAAILAVTFRLSPAPSARDRQKAFLERRKTQPIGERSAGSVFRNPLGAGISAGELIELAGLKGFAMGGAKVSEVHANFFINFNGSTSGDMRALINFVKERVDQMFGIQLKEEIRYVPYN
ncbi:putative UDP-N-acetylmuramate dehydrogenase [Dioscorea sansibarensis]